LEKGITEGENPVRWLFGAVKWQEEEEREEEEDEDEEEEEEEENERRRSKEANVEKARIKKERKTTVLLSSVSLPIFFSIFLSFFPRSLLSLSHSLSHSHSLSLSHLALFQWWERCCRFCLFFFF